MNFDFQKWLDVELEIHEPYEPPKKMKRSERLCFLITANGGSPNVRGYGSISRIPGTTHQDGLEQHQAFELMRYDAYILALQDCGLPVGDLFKPIMDEYCQRHNIPMGVPAGGPQR